MISAAGRQGVFDIRFMIAAPQGAAENMNRRVVYSRGRLAAAGQPPRPTRRRVTRAPAVAALRLPR